MDVQCVDVVSGSQNQKPQVFPQQHGGVVPHSLLPKLTEVLSYAVKFNHTFEVHSHFSFKPFQ